MTDGRRQPADLEAEQHLIGACLMRRDVIGDVVSIVEPSDFLKPQHGHTFSVLVDMWRAGEPVDIRTVSDVLRGQGLHANELMASLSGVPATGHAAKYAEIVARHSTRRRLIGIAGELAESMYALDDPAEKVDVTRSQLESVELPTTKIPNDLYRLSDLMTRPEGERTPWVVPGLLRRDWRVVVVAPEGVGKSLVLQQVGICAAQGVHPFGFEETQPRRVLFVDLENPEERILHGAQLIDPQVRRVSRHYDDNRVWVWNRQGGLNLRSRSDRGLLESVLEQVHPELVCLGPAYKASVREKGEGWDESALATQRTLDQLRVRFGFALLMEDHAPQASGGARDLRPFGSSVWLRWPEIGLKLKPDQPHKPTRLILDRWRGDRLPNSWPSELHRGQMWPWEGKWDERRQEIA